MGNGQILHDPRTWTTQFPAERRSEPRFAGIPRYHAPTWNQVICGDALYNLRRTETGAAGAIITDPPSSGFGLSLQEREIDPWASSETVVSATGETVAWARPIAREMRRVTRPGGAVVLMAGIHAVAAWMVACEEAGLIWMAEMDVLWQVGGQRNHNFGSLMTHILWFAVPGARHTWNSNKRAIYSNVLVCRKVTPTERDHPAQKPVELTTFLVSLLTKRGDGIVDPFCGSGSTLVSCQVVGRDWLGIDQDKRYCQTSTRRVRNWEVEEEGEMALWVNGRLEHI